MVSYRYKLCSFLLSLRVYRITNLHRTGAVGVFGPHLVGATHWVNHVDVYLAQERAAHGRGCGVHQAITPGKGGAASLLHTP